MCNQGFYIFNILGVTLRRWWKMAAVVVWRRHHRRNLTRNRVFRDRKNPLDMYDDVELYNNKFRMYASLFLELGGWDQRHRPVNRIPNHPPCDQRYGRSDAWAGTAADRQNVKFLRLEGFPTVVPCIDGTHVHTSTNMFHSINVQVTCDLSNRKSLVQQSI